MAAAKRKPILIGCPQYLRLVRGTYACDEHGRYALGRGGEFLLERARCDQLGGRCMQTLCALHRYNRRGPTTWYPYRLLAMRQRTRAAGRA
jgi:hypothetical protein